MKMNEKSDTRGSGGDDSTRGGEEKEEEGGWKKGREKACSRHFYRVFYQSFHCILPADNTGQPPMSCRALFFSSTHSFPHSSLHFTCIEK